MAKELNIANSMLVESKLLLATKIASLIYMIARLEIASLNSKMELDMKLRLLTLVLMANKLFSQVKIVHFRSGILKLVD